MSALYRNRTTGIIQRHPVSGIGESLNSDEIGEDGKPFVKLPITKDKIKQAKNLMKDDPKTTGAKTGAGTTTDKEGAE